MEALQSLSDIDNFSVLLYHDIQIPNNVNFIVTLQSGQLPAFLGTNTKFKGELYRSKRRKLHYKVNNIDFKIKLI